MSSYAEGRQPPCLVGHPGCLGKIRQRGGKCCAVCSQIEQRRRQTKPKPHETTSESTTVTGDTCEIHRLMPSQVRTLPDLIRVCEIDITEWAVVTWQCKASQQTSVPRSTRASADEKWTRPSTDPVTVQMFHVSATLKRKVAIIAVRAEIADLIADAKRTIVKRPAMARKPVTNGAMLEIAIPDLHAGKLAWGQETGWQDYDTKIAEKVFEEALATLLARTASYQFARVLLVVGNDLLNSDSLENATTAGTPQSTDGRYQKTFGVVRRMITRAIDQLRAIAPVHVLMVPGNHDTLAVWHLGDSLECYFHDCAGVVIDNAPTMRKYHQFGKVMLLFTHGDKGKHPDYPLLMATEQPAMFGSTVHREAHVGHRHEAKLTEFHGVRVRTSPALCPPDAWHAENTFVGNKRGAEAFVWDAEDGLVNLALYTVPEAR